MQLCQKSINSKGRLSAQHSMPLATAFLEHRPYRQALYKTLSRFTETQRLAGTHLKQTTLDPGSHRTVLVQSSVQATKPILSRVAASSWAICWHSNSSSSKQAHSFTLLWDGGHLHKLQSQQPLQCICTCRGWHCPKSVGGIHPFHTSLLGTTSEHEGNSNKSSLLRHSRLFKNHFGFLSHPFLGWFWLRAGEVWNVSAKMHFFSWGKDESPIPQKQTEFFF